MPLLADGCPTALAVGLPSAGGGGPPYNDPSVGSTAAVTTLASKGATPLVSARTAPVVPV